MDWLSQWITTVSRTTTDLLLTFSRKVFEWYFGTTAHIDPSTGAYVYDALYVQIDHTCAGTNFFGYTLLLTVVLGLWRFGFRSLFVSPFAAFCLSAMANSFRLIASVYAQELGDIFLLPGPHWRLHEWLGYLVFGGVWGILVVLTTQKTTEHHVAPGGNAAAPAKDGRVEKRHAERP